ncbi:hypothetical protein ACFLW8_04395 [Chloroflexota bacterium]
MQNQHTNHHDEKTGIKTKEDACSNIAHKKTQPIPIKSPAGIATPVIPQCTFVSSDFVDILPPYSFSLAFYHN